MEKQKFISLNECKKQSFSRKYVLIDAFRVLKVDKTYRQFVRLTIFAPIFAPVKSKNDNIKQKNEYEKCKKLSCLC